MKHLDRIAALLAKAERTDNPIEAELYLAKAQALATQASVDLAVARARIAKREAREQPTNKTIHIGEPAQRANRHLVALFLSIGHCNALKVDIAHKWRRVPLCGSSVGSGAVIDIGRARDTRRSTPRKLRVPPFTPPLLSASHNDYVKLTSRRLCVSHNESWTSRPRSSVLWPGKRSLVS